jgi:1-acyl-sn-glycerol-3-phosphate acyltransferase
MPPEIPEDRVSWLLQSAARVVCKVLGWTPVSSPMPAKVLFLAAPHTSNWDAFYMLLCAYAIGIRVSWLGKKSLFKTPVFGWWMKQLGGIVVDRSGGLDTTSAIAKVFEGRDALYLGLAPAGTRRRRDHWKSGFYHIARKADVPVLCGFLDYPNKRGGCGPIIELTGEVTQDMDKFRAFYGTITGHTPANTSTVRLESETDDPGDGRGPEADGDGNGEVVVDPLTDELDDGADHSG